MRARGLWRIRISTADVIGMGVQIEVVGDGEIDGLLHPLAFGRLARDVEFADAAVIAAFELVLHEVEDEGIAEPGLDVGAHAIGPDEGDDLQAGWLRIHQRMRAGVGAAGGEDAGDAVFPEQRQHLVDAVIGLRLPIVVHMGVEDFDRLVGAGRAGDERQHDQDSDAPRSRPHHAPGRRHSAATTCGRSSSPVSASCGSSLRRRRRSMRSR